MVPILFTAKATDFTTNGIGRLSDAISCTVNEVRNGPFELTMEYPANGVHASDLVNSNIIVARPAQGASLQAFRIFKISKSINGRVTVYCRHISYQLSFIPFKAFSAASLAGALAGFKANALEPCPFTLTADFTSPSSFAAPLPASIRSYLGGREGSIIDVYGNGAEWEWNNFSCILHANRGADRGVVLRYGKNIVDLQQETNIENTVTGIMPYWTSDTVTVTLAAPVESETAGNFPFPRTVVKDFSDQWESAPTQAQLTAYTQSYIRANKIGVPAVSINLSFVNLSDALEYKDRAPLETVKLCDTITVDFVRLGVSVKAKVVETEYDVLRGRYKSIKIGDARSTLSSTIEEQMTAINQRPTIDQTRTSIDRATGVLNAGLRGHVIINRNAEGWANEILFLDNANVAQARNVLRINTNGIGFSSTGYQGPFYQSWTIDGHFALGGVNNAYGDFEILDSSGKPLGEWNKDGLRFFDSAQKVLLTINHGGLFLYNASGATLAQLTPRGLNVYEGSIEGGRIKIGQKFEVKPDGTMTATGAKFSGAINGGSINIGKNFKVDSDGNMVATSGRFVGGEISNGQNFKVDKDGNVTMRKGSIKIGNNFSVDDSGNLTARNGIFNGGEITIKGKRGDVFKTSVDEDGYQTVSIGGFKVWEAGEGAYLGSADQEVFIGDNEYMCFVTGWDGETYADGDPEENLDNSKFGVVIDYENVYAQEVYANNPICEGSTHYWGIGETIADIYDALDDLANAVGGGGA